MKYSVSDRMDIGSASSIAIFFTCYSFHCICGWGSNALVSWMLGARLQPLFYHIHVPSMPKRNHFCRLPIALDVVPGALVLTEFGVKQFNESHRSLIHSSKSLISHRHQWVCWRLKLPTCIDFHFWDCLPSCFVFSVLLPACVPGDALQSSWSSRETAVVAEKAWQRRVASGHGCDCNILDQVDTCSVSSSQASSLTPQQVCYMQHISTSLQFSLNSLKIRLATCVGSRHEVRV